ncbi:hypothetical protein KFE25_008563 [Diacronema lutheri]|uniref:RIIa domain-containing protein n=1 Tax=Diacronema lutheri TaxID=2081491 RepID=A0A8J5XWV7_DIALT|nr:hypothetical protein KFE25_008563 [Diacronema lutheri]|mmetsp:Transcript_20249/g.62989  ORF Transcript_20249/g.62989 Transcript_20249/m.62989 type:complete len:85 (-) Transcript_20249:283-537(-)
MSGREAPWRRVAPAPGVGAKSEGQDPWAGTAGQREGLIYCAEQVLIPDDLEAVVRLWTKAVLKERPSDIIAFSAQWFSQHAASS